MWMIDICVRIKKKMVFKQSDLLLNIDRIRMDVTDFIRGNPITAVAVGLGVPLSFAGIAAIGKRVRRKKSGRKKTGRKKRSMGRTTIRRSKIRRRKVKKVTHRSPRHKGHKKVTFTTKEGKRVSFLVRKPKHVHRKRRR